MVVSFFNIPIHSTLRKVFLSTQPSPFSFCQLALWFRRLICSPKAKIRVSRQPSEGCPNARKCFILRLFTLFTSVPLTSILPSPHGTIPSGWCQVLCPFAETYPVKKETGPRLWYRAFTATNRCNLWQKWHPYHGLNHWSLWKQVSIRSFLPIQCKASLYCCHLPLSWPLRQWRTLNFYTIHPFWPRSCHTLTGS